MLGLFLGPLAALLGIKAFTTTGLPLTRTVNVTGATAKVIGAICIALGLALIVDGIYGAFVISRSNEAGAVAAVLALAVVGYFVVRGAVHR
jgi:fructose-1,6-bisphosphatase/inositol monophosphatase family enzyme